MFRKGQRLFTSATIGLLLVMVVHTIGHFAPPPADMVTSGVLKAMEAYRIDMGIAKPSMFDALEALSLTMSFMLAWLVAVNLVLAKHLEPGSPVLRAACTVNMVAIAALLAMYIAYRIPPPAISFAIVGAMYGVARWRMPTPA